LVSDWFLLVPDWFVWFEAGLDWLLGVLAPPRTNLNRFRTQKKQSGTKKKTERSTMQKGAPALLGEDLSGQLQAKVPA
jgi:hypothetical protein